MVWRVEATVETNSYTTTNGQRVWLPSALAIGLCALEPPIKSQERQVADIWLACTTEQREILENPVWDLRKEETGLHS